MIEYVSNVSMPETKALGWMACARGVPDRAYVVQRSPVWQRLVTGWKRDFRLVKPVMRGS